MYIYKKFKIVMNIEHWKFIKGYENYMVSDLGRVKSIGRNEKGHFRNFKYDVSYYRKEKILKPHLNYQNGKLISCDVTLYKKQKAKTFLIHRLVAEAFLPNPNNYPVIDHIDTNPLNNVVNNLKWCTQSDNCKNPLTLKKNKLNHKKQKIPVICSKDGLELICFFSITDAALYFNMKSSSSILNCLRGKAKTAYGYKWKYKEVS